MRLLAVHAHPDDEASKGAATMARYVAEGHQVRVVTCTGGERGDILNPRLAVTPELVADMPAVRRAEMAEAAAILGVEHVWLGFVDSGLPEGDPLPPLPEGSFAVQPFEVTVPALADQIRAFRPHVLLTYNERGGYPHPDHIMTHEVSVRAVRAAADPSLPGEPWAVQKVYYDVSFSQARLETVHAALIARGEESPYEAWLERRDPAFERTATARIHVADYFEQRDAALRAHATQIDPEGFFFHLPRDLEREIWPVEEFELARSLVPTAPLEDDLFAGVVDDDAGVLDEDAAGDGPLSGHATPGA